MSRIPNYEVLDPLLARLAIRDNHLEQNDIDVLREVVAQGGNEDGVREYVRRVLPGWENRPDVLALLTRVLAAGHDLDV